MKSLKKTLTVQMLLLILIFALNFTVLAQTQISGAPIKWQNYAVRGQQASFLMPKLPVVFITDSWCRGERTENYGSYADGAAYVVRIISKIDVPDYCREKKKFDQNNFRERVQALKSELQLNDVSGNEQAESNELKLTAGNRIYRLINDYENKRWFEFQVVGAVDETKTEVKDFLNSLKIKEKSSGIEIGDGAVSTLGDEIAATPNSNPSNPIAPNGGSGLSTDNGSSPSIVTTDMVQKTPLTIVFKPRASYTEAARQNKVEGKVVLKLTFLASGGTGSISIVKALPFGLTEQAIAAARRIVFLPAQHGNQRVSVTKTIEYTFSIY